MTDTRVMFSRRRFLQGLGAAAVGAWALPTLPGVAAFSSAATGDDAEPDGFTSGVASFDPTESSVLLWTRVDGAAVTSVDWTVWSDPNEATPVATGSVQPHGDQVVHVEVTGLEPGTHYWYRFAADGATSALGRTKTATGGTDITPVSFAVASCQSFQDGFYAAWRDIAAQDVDAVVFLGDYIYEYPTAPAEDSWRQRRHRHPDTGAEEGETYSLDDYRRRYRIYRSDPALRAAHRNHPFICVWDDHEVANDRWSGGAQNHDASEGSYDDREAAGVQAYFEYCPSRVGTLGPTSVARRLGYGGLVELFLLDSRTFRDQPEGGFNSNFNPAANLDEPSLSAQGRTILGAAQKEWLRAGLRESEATWKVLGNQIMVTPLNLAVLPDLIGGAVSDFSKEHPELPVTYHPDGIPVNSDQWDGYQVERREVLGWLRGDDGGDPVADVVILTGDIHIGWTNEVYVEQGDSPIAEPVAIELVCPGISSENLNERIGTLSIGRPLPEGTTNKAGPAALAMNRHVRYVDFDANGYALLHIDSERVVTRQRILVRPHGADPMTSPVWFDDASAIDAPGGTWQALRGSSRLLPALPPT